MSSSILKRGMTVVKQDTKRVIDTNEMVAKKIADLSLSLQGEEAGFSDGFVAGIAADEVEVLLSDEEQGMEGGQPENESVSEAGMEAIREEMLQQTREEIAQMWEEERAKLSAERDNVLNEAREQGYQEGSNQAQAEWKTKKEELDVRQQQFMSEYEAMLAEAEPKMVDILTDIYQKVLGIELKNYRDIILYLIENAMKTAEGSREFLIHVSKEDYPYVSMQKKQITANVSGVNSYVEIVEDLTLAKNECMIETDGGIFDCGLGTQLEELADKIKLLSYERCEKEE